MPETIAGMNGSESSRRVLAWVLNDAEVLDAQVTILRARGWRAVAGLAGNLDQRPGVGR